MDKNRLTQLSNRAVRSGADCIIRILSSLEDAEQSKLLFDVVLVDAPCSSTGVIRRHVGLREGTQHSYDYGNKIHANCNLDIKNLTFFK